MPGFMREGVAAHDRLVGLHVFTGQLAQQLAGREQLLRVDADLDGTRSGRTRADHDDLFERRVARALADAVDRAFDLPYAGRDRGERVGDRQAEVVMTMRAEHRAVRVRHPADDVPEELADFVGRRVTRPCPAD